MKMIIVISALIILSTMGTGFWIIYKEYKTTKRRIKKAITANLAAFIPTAIACMVVMIPKITFAMDGGTQTSSSSGLGFIAAALSTGLATIGAGYAVGAVGSSALGAVSEDPKILGKTLIFVGLAEGIAIYGLIVSILILGRL